MFRHNSNISVASTKKEGTLTNSNMLAVLKGHKSLEAPTIVYVPNSGCLISGDKLNKKSKMVQH
jgi:hypothetical protein